MVPELTKVVDSAQKLGAEFADVRLEKHRVNRINVANGDVRSFTSTTGFGVAIRVKLKSAWGLAVTSVPTSDSLRDATSVLFCLYVG